MVERGKIAEYRQILDHTLASHDLTDEKKLEALVKDNILRSSEDKNRDCIDTVIERKTAEVLNFLEMLRSASEHYDNSSDKTQHASWKLKQDNEEFRVMYREGPVGSPFHSLLVEGYIDAPLDVCLCVSLETTFYQRWFPEIHFPTFKVVVAKTLKKIRIGEQISLVRVKLLWPLSSREAVIHYFEFEYLEDGLIVVLLNTIPDVANITMETHGFTNDGIPEAGNTVRIDLVGGFALQKVTENRSYFRTIGNMDIKLDFVPPSLINFISRQLIGTGFRFYQKMLASIAKGDDEFGKALDDPLYERIRKALLSNSKSKSYLGTQTNGEEQTVAAHNVSRKEDTKVLANGQVNGYSQMDNPLSNEIEQEDIEGTTNVKPEKVLGLGDMFNVEDQKVVENGHANGYSTLHKPNTEIEEEETEEIVETPKSHKGNNIGHTKDDIASIDQTQVEHLPKKVQISPQVEQALSYLDKMISFVREGRLITQEQAQSSPEIEGNEVRSSTPKKHVQWEDKLGNSTEEENTKVAADVPENGNPVNGLRSLDSSDSQPGLLIIHSSTSPVQHRTFTSSPRSSPSLVSPMTVQTNGIHGDSPMETKKIGQRKKWRLCCLHLISRRLV